MRRCLILLACVLSSFPALAEMPGPGAIAEELANTTPTPDQPAAINVAQVSGHQLASSSLPSATSAKSATSVTSAISPTSPPQNRPPTPISPPSPKPAAPPTPTPVAQTVAPAAPANTLAPPPDPKPAPLPAPATSPMALRNESVTPKPDVKTDSDARTSVNVNRYDGAIRDSIGLVSVPTAADVIETTPLYFQRVDYLRKHNDPVLASAYLREIVTSSNILPQYRARAILELADSLSSERQQPEALCWLKIWMELYPSRPEFGAVAYRVGTLYREMGLSSMARDSFYLALAHAVNQGQVQNAEDLKRYTRLTEATLWELAANEYQSGQWARAAELLARYRNEATSASPTSMEKAAFLQADCYYQLKQTDKAVSLYEATLKDHPFNPLAPQARLRLYHLYVTKKDFENARDDLEALAWTVRTVWPKEETYWQRQTAQLLLALNEKNAAVLPPLLQRSSQLPPEGKTWQEALDHYDALVSYQAATTHAIMDTPANLSRKANERHAVVEETELMAMNNTMNQLLPSPRTASSP
jgi:outer membrane protein assembly factor BamD (BamD/ComL family)